MSRRTKRRGHFCWCCGRVRANEAFSGRGHARHHCRDCARLGKEELELRQVERNLDRAMTWEGRIRRKQRPFVEKHAVHPNARLRSYAEKLLVIDQRTVRPRFEGRQEHGEYNPLRDLEEPVEVIDEEIPS